MCLSLPLLREAKRPSGVEWNAGGIPDPRGDRAAAVVGEIRGSKAGEKVNIPDMFLCTVSCADSPLKRGGLANSKAGAGVAPAVFYTV